MNQRLSILAPEVDLPAEGAEVPSFENGQTLNASELLDTYATVLESVSVTFNVSADGSVSLGAAAQIEDLVNLEMGDNGSGELEFTLDEGAGRVATVDLAATVAKVTNTFDAEDGLRKLVEGIAVQLRNTVPAESGRPVPLVRFQSTNESDDSGGVAQLLGVWLANDEQLETLRSKSDGEGIIFEEAEMEGRGLREAVAALAILGVAVGGTISHVDASPVRKQAAQSQKVVQKSGQASARIDHKALAKVSPSSTMVIVDVEDQRAYLIADGKIIIDTPVSTARKGKYTPRGEFHLTQRVRTGKRSTIYGCALPYWMRLDQSAIGLHVGELPGYPASAGCIRLPEEIAPLIFDHTEKGTTVKVMSSFQPQVQIASR